MASGPSRSSPVRFVEQDGKIVQARPSSSSLQAAPFSVSKNPFSQRQASQPETSTSIIAPSLPPRRAIKPEGLSSLSAPGVKHRTGSSSSSLRSQDSSALYPPTSISTPSLLMQNSLLAAKKGQAVETRDDVILHVIRRSSDASLTAGYPASRQSTTDPLSSHTSPRKNKRWSKNAHLIAHVSQALKEAEDDLPRVPPARNPSTRMWGKLDSLVQQQLDENPDTRVWSCVDLLSGRAIRKPYAMIILNQPISRKDVFIRAWDASELRYCADGGANRLFDIWNTDQRSGYLPTMIKGDLDSIRSDVQNYYSSKGVTVMYDGNQYSTDLVKCISEIEAIERSTGKTYSLLLFGGLSGRIDQTVHTMSLLHKLRSSRPNSFALSGESLAWVLDAGSHLIEIDHSTMGETCGILPVGVDSAMVKTRGLKWDIDWATSFDGEVSTSNHLVANQPMVCISTNRPILWCVEVRSNMPFAVPRNAQRASSLAKTGG